MKIEFVHAGKDFGWHFKDGNKVIFAQGASIPLELARDLAGRLSAGWQPWAGGEIPPEADGRRIDLEMRDGEIWLNQPADNCEWGHYGEDADIVLWRPTRCKKWSFDSNGWHDIDVFQHANQRLAQHADGQAVVWPDESRADRDPTAVQGGIVQALVEQPEPPTLTVQVEAGGCAPQIVYAANRLIGLAAGAVGFVLAMMGINHGWVDVAFGGAVAAMFGIYGAAA